MSKLRTLRSQLASLRTSRQFMRQGTGYAALLIALLWILLAIFLLDFGFQLIEFQRAIVIAIGIGALVWAAMKYTAPFLGQHETDIDMALLVERQHKIDSDLVAALQFESPEADAWGSRELEDAVVDYVAQLDRGLDVYEGISHEQFWRRVGVLAATAALVVGLVAVWPAHAHAFLMRLALGKTHYPSNTNIERILVNGNESLIAARHGTAPEDTSAVQGRPVVFAAWAAGEVPAEGEVTVYPKGGGARQLQLTKLDRDELHSATKLLGSHVRPQTADDAQALSEMTVAQRTDTARLLASATGFDSARLDQALRGADPQDPVLRAAWEQLKRLDDAAGDSGAAESGQLFVGKLPRLLDPAGYKISLGDAWTDRANLAMIALPVIEPRFIEHAPEYARRGKEEPADPASLQRSVIEGSRLELAIGSTKPLQEATLTIIASVDGRSQRQSFPLSEAKSTASKFWPSDGDAKPPRHLWRLPSDATALAQVREPFRFELQVIDEDGLSLETPLRGAVRLKSDRPPRISGALVHRVVVPTARPEIEMRAGDDYGVAAMQAHVSVIRGESSSAQPSAASEATFPITYLLPLRGDLSPAAAAQRKRETLKFPLQGEAIPKVGAFVLELSSLALERGDEVRIVLEAIDYRGKEMEGVRAESEPIILDITDESGILAAVSEGDRRSQEQIDDLIRRQLGIGETP